MRSVLGFSKRRVVLAVLGLVSLVVPVLVLPGAAPVGAVNEVPTLVSVPVTVRMEAAIATYLTG
jgi:hypothetical protein